MDTTKRSRPTASIAREYSIINSCNSCNSCNEKGRQTHLEEHGGRRRKGGAAHKGGLVAAVKLARLHGQSINRTQRREVMDWPSHLQDAACLFL
jgi:hypothetical protein